MRLHTLIRTAVVAAAALSLTACAAPAREPWPQAGPSQTTATTFITLDPIPAQMQLPTALARSLSVTPLTDAYIQTLRPVAAVQLQYNVDDATASMVANVLWFSIPRFNTLMATPDAPKGIKLGIVDGHVLFVQPALDMPFDPTSEVGLRYGELVKFARTFTSFSMLDTSLTLLRPCPVVDEWPTTDVTAAMRTAITEYFTAQQLNPAAPVSSTAWVLDVEAQSLGTHACANVDGGVGGYSGAVPLGSQEAVLVQVRHEPYPATGVAVTFVTLARKAAGEWQVVSEGTGP